jgi:hypothetical protein
MSRQVSWLAGRRDPPGLPGAFCLSMIFPENRYALFGIMLER